MIAQGGGRLSPEEMDMRRQWVRWALIGGMAAAGMAAAAAPAGDGLTLPDDATLWPRWQARLTLTAATGDGLSLAAPLPLRQAALLGDYYLRPDGMPGSARWRGGLRATGGLVLGHLGHSVATAVSPLAISMNVLDAAGAGFDATAADQALAPYVGIGYTGLSTGGSWAFSADLGLMVRQPGAALDVGRAMLGAQGLDDALRQLDLAPVVRFGVRYSF